jgi:ketosteroid isomerase-like protein
MESDARGPPRDTEAVSQENVDLARRMVGWFNERDSEAAQAHSTDDVEIVPLRAAVEDTVYRGPNAFAAFGADNDDAWEELHFEPEAVRDTGEQVVVIGQLSARARATGADVTARLAMVLELRDGQFSKLQTYVDVAAALEAAGLRE